MTSKKAELVLIRVFQLLSELIFAFLDLENIPAEFLGSLRGKLIELQHSVESNDLNLIVKRIHAIENMLKPYINLLAYEDRAYFSTFEEYVRKISNIRQVPITDIIKNTLISFTEQLVNELFVRGDKID